MVRHVLSLESRHEKQKLLLTAINWTVSAKAKNCSLPPSLHHVKDDHVYTEKSIASNTHDQSLDHVPERGKSRYQVGNNVQSGGDLQSRYDNRIDLGY